MKSYSCKSCFFEVIVCTPSTMAAVSNSLSNFFYKIFLVLHMFVRSIQLISSLFVLDFTRKVNGSENNGQTIYQTEFEYMSNALFVRKPTYSRRICVNQKNMCFIQERFSQLYYIWDIYLQKFSLSSKLYKKFMSACLYQRSLPWNFVAVEFMPNLCEVFNQG